jgi:hypothetical protein
VALSMAEVEYLEGCVVAVWILEILSRLFGIRIEETYICCENQSCMNFSKNPMVYDRLKHK